MTGPINLQTHSFEHFQITGLTNLEVLKNIVTIERIIHHKHSIHAKSETQPR
jgi:hypothetical protein